jgi:hypothetical protein
MPETTFQTTIKDADDNDIEVTVEASGEIDHADPEVGIYSDGIGYVTVHSVTDENGKPVDFDAKAIEEKAHEELLNELDQ